MVASYSSIARDKLATQVNEKELSESYQLNDQALKLFKKGKIKESIAVWEKASKLAINPETGYANAEVLNNLGFAYYKLGSQYYPKASEILHQAQSADPQRWTAYLNLGDLYEATNDHAMAIEFYKKVLDLNPDYKQSAVLIAKIKKVDKKYAFIRRPVISRQIVDASTDTATANSDKQMTSYTYVFKVHPRLPAYKLRLYRDKNDFPLSIDILNSVDNKVLQTIKINSSKDAQFQCDAYVGDHALEMIDMNFDGYQDLRLYCRMGLHEAEHLFWLYDLRSNKLIFSPALSELGEPTPRPDTKTIITDVHNGCAGLCRYISTYKWVGNKLTLLDARSINLEETDEAALFVAIKEGNSETAKQLIKKGAEINRQGNNDFTPLMSASEHGRKEIVEILLANGADINANDEYGKTALLLAIDKGHKDIALFLLEKGANVNAAVVPLPHRGMPPLIQAIKAGQIDVAQSLLLRGANPNVSIGNVLDGDHTALSLALENGQREISKLLVLKGAVLVKPSPKDLSPPGLRYKQDFQTLRN